MVNGKTFTVGYLKESYRLTTKTLAGESHLVSLEEPRVKTRRGLPLIIPGDLRLRLEARDPVLVKAVLTILSIYRLIPAKPKLKLETITSPSKGIINLIPELSLIMGLKFSSFIPKRNKLMIRGFKRILADKSPLDPVRSLLSLQSAGPNSKVQNFAYPIDSFLIYKDEQLLRAFEVISKYVGNHVLDIIQSDAPKVEEIINNKFNDHLN